MSARGELHRGAVQQPGVGADQLPGPAGGAGRGLGPAPPRPGHLQLPRPQVSRPYYLFKHHHSYFILENTSQPFSRTCLGLGREVATKQTTEKM